MRKQYNIVAALSLFCSINASAQFSASYPNHVFITIEQPKLIRNIRV